jgi:phosphatidylinositol glycan class B
VIPKALPARVVLALGLGVGLLLRLVIVFGGDEGIVWPDEVYQSFEPAHRLVFGHGLVPWEFIDGARNWALPGFVAFWLKLCAVLGADSPTVYVHVVKLVFALMSVGAAWGAYRLALVLGADELFAASAAALWSLAALALYFGHRAMSENASAATVVWGLALVLDRAATRRRVLLGASLLGIATLFRLQAGLFCAGALAVLAARVVTEKQTPTPTPWRRVGEVLLVLVAWAVAFGALDAATWHDAPGAKWGGWFHSAVVYLRFNLIEGRASGWGTSPWTYYGRFLFSSMPEVTVLLALGGLLSLRRAPGVALLALAFAAVHLAVGHKEMRFILPVLPVACALVGVGASALAQWLTARGTPAGAPAPSGVDAKPSRATWAVAGVVVLAATVSAARHRGLTMGEVGSYLDRPKSSAWDDFGNVNRLLLVASRQKDLCGLRVDVAHMAWVGGSTYLHTKAPLFPAGVPHQQGYFNYVITFPGSGAEVIAQDKGIELVRLPGMSSCVPYPGYTWKLP